MVLGVLTISCASANDLNVTDEIESVSVNEEIAVNDTADSVVVKNASYEVSNRTNYINGSNVNVKVVDDNGSALSNKSVLFSVDGKKSYIITDGSGVAKLNLNYTMGTHVIKYKLKDNEYSAVTASKTILLLSTKKSKIKAKDYTAYRGIENPYTVVLTVGGVPLEGRKIAFTINNKTYVRKTNSQGQAVLNIKLKVGTYKVGYNYTGEDNIKPRSGEVTIEVKKGMPTSIKKYYSTIYRHKTSAAFKIKVLDERGNPVANKNVKFTINKKTYTVKTNKNGIAKIKIKLSKGTYKLTAKFPKDYPYKSSSKTYTIKVKPKQARNNGFWLLSTDMDKVDFDKLEKLGTKHIFLNAKCVERFGKLHVEEFIRNASAHSIKVHLWVQVFYSGGEWVSPVKKGKYNYDFMKSKITECKKYAKIKGLSGIHFDYLRFPYGAYNHKNGVKAINYFTKKACTAIHKKNSKLIISAAVMPEPSVMKSEYGQDIATISKYLDVIVPMVYKGNYHGSASWIQKVTQTFVKKSNGAKIWTGLQSYRSDEDWTKLSSKELMNDADAAALGGAHGVILFRYGLFNDLNFNEV